MSEEDKYNGLDCAICAETKCPNEEKEKIINGIDVSECEWLNTCGKKIRCVILQNDVCASDNTCQGYRDCYFKQFKRLEQREKALTEIADDLQKRNHDLTLTNERLEEENEELKENVEILQNQIIQEHEQYNNLTHDSIDDLKLIRKYKQQIEAYQLSENEAKEIIAELEYKNKDYLKQLDALKPENVYLHKTIKKYEQTLKEIKEISEPVKKDICNNCGWQDSDCCEPEGCACNEFITILHKIDEVINEK